jgi:hypothetical protein
VAEKTYLARAPGVFKLYARVGDNYKLIHSVDVRLSVRIASGGNYRPVLNTNQKYFSYIKSFCDNEILSDTYVLVVSGLATPVLDFYKRFGNYLSFNEFNLYDGNSTYIRTTHIARETDIL